LFRMPTTPPSIRARGSEYTYQYVGSAAGGVDAKFAASNLENPNGAYDFDNWGCGWVELYNCKQGAELNVFSQQSNALIRAKHCVPLYQDLIITARDTAGVVVPDVRFTTTETPTNSPTITITTNGNLKTWDFRNPATYETTTDVNGVATSSPVLNVWYFETSFKQSLRFPASTAVYQGRAYNYKTLNVSAVLGSSAAIPVSAGMIGLDTATTVNEATALAYTGITFAPSGATGGTVTISSSRTLQEIWNAYRAWISQFANRSSNDTWGCIGGNMSMGAWNMVVDSGVTLSGSGNVTSVSTTGSVTNNGTITAIYTSSAGTSSTLQLVGVSNNGVAAVWNPSTSATELFQTNVSGSAATYTVYYPPGSTGLVKNYARELFGFNRVSGSITLAAGLNTISFIDIPDVGITETTQATVAAYTTLEFNSKLYDYVAYSRLSEQFIKLGQLLTRAGTAIEWQAGYSGKLKATNAAVLSLTGNTIFFKANSLSSDDKFRVNILVSPATLTADTTEVFATDIEDGNGDSSVTIQAAGVSTFEIWKIADATPPDDYATGTLVDTVGIGKYRFLSAPGFKFVIRDTTTNFRVVVEAEKGIYTAELFFGAAVQLAQSAEVSEINTKVDIMQIDVEAIKGTGFVKDSHSLINIKEAADTSIAVSA